MADLKNKAKQIAEKFMSKTDDAAPSLEKAAVNKLARGLAQNAMPSMSPFDAAPETLNALGEIADTVDAPRKWFIEKAFDQMDLVKQKTGEADPAIEFAKGAADMILPSAYDLVPGSKATKAASIVEKKMPQLKSAAKALQETPGINRVIHLPSKGDVRAAEALSRPILFAGEGKILAAQIAERKARETAMEKAIPKMPPVVSAVEGKSVPSLSVTKKD